ncbi:hypothetical protein [Ketobacter nezhaii]|uniref:hypothetical protein n=1 Tax=Ketobacter sp. MCCC 1A13808 TaxID=2602738 RepID=UPI0018DCAE19|nr:hypothetical protein [Ketobacter sp. MCCC 1A13808]
MNKKLNDELLKRYKQGIAGVCNTHGESIFWLGVAKKLRDRIDGGGNEEKLNIAAILLKEIERGKKMKKYILF